MTIVSTSTLSMQSVRRRAIDRLTTSALITAGVAVIVPLVAILLFVFVKGIPALNAELFTENPGPTGIAGGGVKNSIVGSAVLVGLALAIGLPFAIATGIFLSEYARQGRLGFTVRFLLDVLAGVPSITIGVFVYTAVVLQVGHFSALAGAIALALILLPVVARVTEEMLLLVPQSTREAAYALGVPKWRTVIGVVLPAAATGIATGIILAAARIAGEAAPLLFTALGNNFYSTAITRPIDALPLRIFTYATGPFAYQHDQAWAGSFVLVGLVLALSLGVRALLARRRM
jgi:phosphate transport system permease protein